MRIINGEILMDEIDRWTRISVLSNEIRDFYEGEFREISPTSTEKIVKMLKAEVLALLGV